MVGILKGAADVVGLAVGGALLAVVLILLVPLAVIVAPIFLALSWSSGSQIDGVDHTTTPLDAIAQKPVAAHYLMTKGEP